MKTVTSDIGPGIFVVPPKPDSNHPAQSPSGDAPPPAALLHWRSLAAPLAVLALAVIFFAVRKPVSPPAAPPTAVVESADIVQIVQAAGVLQPKLKVDVGAEVGGQVTQLHAQLGQSVKAGEPLVSLDPEAARNAVRQAEFALAQQQATVDRARIELSAAQREAERQRRLLAGEATTVNEKEAAEIAAAKLAADYAGQQATLDQRSEDVADKRMRLTHTRVLAPIDGEVVALAVQEGQTVNALQATPTLLTLAQMRTMTVKTHVAEAEIGLVKIGQPVSFTTLAAQARRYTGRVRAIQPIPERVGNALFYDVLFDVDNAEQSLLSEMTVQVDIEVGRAHQVPALPITALDRRDGAGRYSVRVLDATGRDGARLVRVGLRDDVHAQVLDGLALGERVLLNPAQEAQAASSAASR